MALDMTKPVCRIEFNVPQSILDNLNAQAARKAAGLPNTYTDTVYDMLDCVTHISIETIISINGTVVLDETE